MSPDTEAELRARIRELEACRVTVVESGIAERRRIERELHDGAQQRLVALSLQLGIARSRLPHDPESAAETLDTARGELGLALGELREIARGIHPAILTDRGLGPALEALADRVGLPVDLTELPEERLPPCVEATAYYVVSEALANIARYAAADSVRVRVVRVNGHAEIEVRDDGVGGADPRAGSGLRGLADRVAGLDGTLEVVSPPGAGTIIRAEVPCASS